MRRILLPLFALALLTATAAFAASGSWTDPAGDAPGGPDVVRVQASLDGGRATFVVVTSNAAGWDGAVAFVLLDTVPGAGDATGTDDELTLHSLHDHVTHERWSGTDWEIVEPTRATFSLSGSTLTIGVPLAELGDPASISFVVQTRGAAGGDDAPDTGTWKLSTAPPLAARFTPAAPVHGKLFTVGGVASCVVKLGWKTLAGGCRPRIPAPARGKALTVAVRANGQSRTYRFTVR
jgi:hypothetical protein